MPHFPAKKNGEKKIRATGQQQQVLVRTQNFFSLSLAAIILVVEKILLFFSCIICLGLASESEWNASHYIIC